jgi:hypothetical protein
VIHLLVCTLIARGTGQSRHKPELIREGRSGEAQEVGDEGGDQREFR